LWTTFVETAVHSFFKLLATSGIWERKENGVLSVRTELRAICGQDGATSTVWERKEKSSPGAYG